MKKTLISAFSGALIASILTWIVMGQKVAELPENQRAVISLLDQLEAPDLRVAQSEVHKQQSNIDSIDDILKIKSDFKQTEMLYALAARKQPKALLGLIKQADSIYDPSDRSYALSILFSRLTELSPALALEVVSDARFIGDDNVNRAIWRTWSRQDFAAALIEVNKLSPLSRKELAARAMYRAVGVVGNDKSREIESTTGVTPSRWAIAQGIEKIAKVSIAEAIAEINQLGSVSDQRYVAESVAVIAAVKDPELALSYSDLFVSGKVSDRYESIVLKTHGSLSPESVLQNWAAENYNPKQATAAFSALAQYANENFQMSMEYVDQVPGSPTKTQLIRVLLAVKSRTNAIDALALAQRYDEIEQRGLLGYLVGQMIKVSPVSALLALDGAHHVSNHKQHVARAIGGLADLDPSKAINEIQLLSNSETKTLANQELIKSWAQADINAALDYALDLDDLGDFSNSFGISLVGADIDLGMRYLDKFGDVGLGNSTYTFAVDLASRYSVSELVNTLQLYTANRQFDQIKSSLLTASSANGSRDIETLIDAFWSGDEKAEAYINYARQISYKNPQDALDIMSKLDKEGDKQTLLHTVVQKWAYQDIARARKLVEGLPGGTLRDTGISAISGRLSSESNRDIQLVNSIGDDQVREESILTMLSVGIKGQGEKVLDQGRSLGLSEDKIAHLKVLADCHDGESRDFKTRKKCLSLFY